jgi:hypothetical protein
MSVSGVGLWQAKRFLHNRSPLSENQEKLIDLRRRVGRAYMEFLEGYITKLPFAHRKK